MSDTEYITQSALSFQLQHLQRLWGSKMSWSIDELNSSRPQGSPPIFLADFMRFIDPISAATLLSPMPLALELWRLSPSACQKCFTDNERSPSVSTNVLVRL